MSSRLPLLLIVTRTCAVEFCTAAGKRRKRTLRAGQVLELAGEPEEGRWATRVRVPRLGRATLPNDAFAGITLGMMVTFVAFWQEAGSVADVAYAVGLPAPFVRALAAHLKGKGVDLKTMPGRRRRCRPQRPPLVPEADGRTPRDAADAVLQMMLGLARAR
jgi:hypothetical protein